MFHSSETDKKVKILVNPCVNEVDRTLMRKSVKPCAAEPLEGAGMQLYSKVRRAVIMNTAVKDGKHATLRRTVRLMTNS